MQVVLSVSSVARLLSLQFQFHLALINASEENRGNSFLIVSDGMIELVILAGVRRLGKFIIFQFKKFS